MEMVELAAEVRSVAGERAARRLRREGKLPAVFYGPKRQATLIAVDAREFVHKVSALEGAHLIRFQSSAADVRDRVALVKETQFHPVTGSVLHADFYEVDMTQKLRVRAPLHFVGKAVGVALGGILQPVCRDVEVECLPTDIPEFISVDVSALGIHDTVHVSRLQIPQGVEILYDSDFTVVTVLPPSIEEVKAPEAAAVEAVTEVAPGAEVAPKPEAEKKGGAA